MFIPNGHKLLGYSLSKQTQTYAWAKSNIFCVINLNSISIYKYYIKNNSNLKAHQFCVFVKCLTENIQINSQKPVQKLLVKQKQL